MAVAVQYSESFSAFRPLQPTSSLAIPSSRSCITISSGNQNRNVKIGGLWKRSQGVSRFTKPNYKHRVFILTDQALSYYGGTVDRVGQLKGRVPLDTVRAVEFVEVKAFNLAHTMQVIYHSKKSGFITLYVTATTKEECADWVATLREVCYFNLDMLMHYHPGALFKNKWTCCKQRGRMTLGCQPTYHLLTRSSSRYAQMRRRDTLTNSTNRQCRSHSGSHGHRNSSDRRSVVTTAAVSSTDAEEVVVSDDKIGSPGQGLSNSCIELHAYPPHHRDLFVSSNSRRSSRNSTEHSIGMGSTAIKKVSLSEITTSLVGEEEGEWGEGREGLHVGNENLSHVSKHYVRSEVGKMTNRSRVAPVWSLKDPISRGTPHKEPIHKDPINGGSLHSGGTPHGDPINGGTPHSDPISGGTPHSDPINGGSLHSDPISGGTPHGDPISGGTPHRDPISGGTPHGDPISGGSLHSDPISGGSLHSDPIIGGSLHSDPISGGTPHSDPISGGTPHSDPISGGTPHRDPISGGSLHGDPISGGTPYRDLSSSISGGTERSYMYEVGHKTLPRSFKPTSKRGSKGSDEDHSPHRSQVRSDPLGEARPSPIRPPRMKKGSINTSQYTPSITPITESHAAAHILTDSGERHAPHLKHSRTFVVQDKKLGPKGCSYSHSMGALAKTLIQPKISSSNPNVIHV